MSKLYRRSLVAGAAAMIDAFVQYKGPGFGDDMAADHLIGSLRAFLTGEA